MSVRENFLFRLRKCLLECTAIMERNHALDVVVQVEGAFFVESGYYLAVGTVISKGSKFLSHTHGWVLDGECGHALHFY